MAHSADELARELLAVRERLTDLQYEVKQENARVKDILARLDEEGQIDLEALQEERWAEDGGPKRRRPTTRIGKLGPRRAAPRRRKQKRAGKPR